MRTTQQAYLNKIQRQKTVDYKQQCVRHLWWRRRRRQQRLGRATGGPAAWPQPTFTPASSTRSPSPVRWADGGRGSGRGSVNRSTSSRLQQQQKQQQQRGDDAAGEQNIIVYVSSCLRFLWIFACDVMACPNTSMSLIEEEINNPKHRTHRERNTPLEKKTIESDIKIAR